MKGKIRIIAIIAEAVVLLCSLVAVGCSQSMIPPEAGDFSIESVREECERMTASDDLDDSEGEKDAIVKVGDYIQAVENNGENVSRHSEYLYRIIPEEFFHHTGRWFYRGGAYSFFVESSAAAKNKYVSDVLILDHNFSVDENTSAITAEIRLFSRRYSTEQSENNWVSDLIGPSARKYYMGNLKLFSAVQNEHADNFYEEGYYKSGDEGLVIQTGSFLYNGLYEEKTSGKFSPVSKADFVYSTGDIYLESDRTERESQFPVYSSVFESGHANRQLAQKELCEGEEQFVYFNTKEYQAQDVQRVEFEKAAELAPLRSNIYIGNSARMITYLNGGGSESRIAAMIGYVLYAADSKETRIINENGEYTDPASADEQDTIRHFYDEVAFEQVNEADEGENDGYLLREDSVQEFYFFADKNAQYKVDAGEDRELCIVDADGGGTATEWAAEHIYRFISNQTYRIAVRAEQGNFEQRKYVLTIDFAPKDINIGENVLSFTDTNSEWFVLNLPKNYIYRFDYSDPDVTLYVRDESLGMSYASGNGARFKKYEDSPFYVEVHADEKITKEVTIFCYQERDVVFYMNGAEGPFVQTIRKGETVVLPEPSNLPNGLIFSGWWDAEDDSGKQISAEDIWDIDALRIELFARYGKE